MDVNYKPILADSDRLQHRMRELIDAGDGTDNNLAVQAHEVMCDIRADKAPRTVEARILDLQHQLQRHTGEQTGAISPQDARTMVDGYERLRRSIRDLPHY